MHRFPLIFLVSVFFSTQSFGTLFPLNLGDPIPASPSGTEVPVLSPSRSSPTGTEAGRYNWHHIKVSQANQGSGTAVKQLEVPKGLGQTRCSAPGEHTGLSLQSRGCVTAREVKGELSSRSARRDCTHLQGEGINLCRGNTWTFYTLFITPTGAHLVMEMTSHTALETAAAFHLGQAVGELAGQVCPAPSGLVFTAFY